MSCSPLRAMFPSTANSTPCAPPTDADVIVETKLSSQLDALISSLRDAASKFTFAKATWPEGEIWCSPAVV